MKQISLNNAPFPGHIGFTWRLPFWQRLRILFGVGIRIEVDYTGSTRVQVGSGEDMQSSATLNMNYPAEQKQLPEGQVLKTVG